MWSLAGKYYQVIGHGWDHETKDFKVFYRPLYHCPAKKGSFEAHLLACSHFERWEKKFTQLSEADVSQLPAEVKAYILGGPFVFDPEWGGPLPAQQCRTLPRTRGEVSQSVNFSLFFSLLILIVVLHAARKRH